MNLILGELAIMKFKSVKYFDILKSIIFANN